MSMILIIEAALLNKGHHELVTATAFVIAC